jgi:hypothetical protein
MKSIIGIPTVRDMPVSDEIYYWYSNGKRYAGGLYKDKSGTMILMPFLRIE